MKNFLIIIGLTTILTGCFPIIKISTDYELNVEQIPDKLLIIFLHDSLCSGFANGLKKELVKELINYETIAYSYDKTNFDSIYLESFFESKKCNGILNIESSNTINREYFMGITADYILFGISIYSLKNIINPDSINNKLLWHSVLKIKWNNNLESRINLAKKKIIRELYE